ncbi:hypothetical protein WAI453_003746 [Rhynchosporium graminicola]|uniref:Uncharacterized protein n=1 Tax=Rhynchosporium graminicola TaxID=2792576 RepID=A0A1E1JZQ4_9HELO|nr:uncharacterized protein RCO7_01450 [Rhynchosporium commune]
MPSIASLSESRNNSIISILRESPQGEAQLQDACAWYTGYLEFKIREHWVGFFRDLLKKVNPLSDIPYNQDLSAAFEVLKVVVDGLSREGVALFDTLDNEKLLKYTNDERTHAKQLVFVVFGDPVPRGIRSQGQHTPNHQQLSRNLYQNQETDKATSSSASKKDIRRLRAEFGV